MAEEGMFPAIHGQNRKIPGAHSASVGPLVTQLLHPVTSPEIGLQNTQSQDVETRDDVR